MGSYLEDMPDPVMILTPRCPRCERTEAPVIMPGVAAKCIRNLLRVIEADICCKKCGAVMDLELDQ